MNVSYSLPPIAIFAYNRLDSLRKLWESLLKCERLGDRSIVIFHDGLKHNAAESNREKWSNVSAWLLTLSHLPNVQIRTSDNNKGLAQSIHGGVSELLTSHDSVIVLEDDLILANSFLTFMDTALVAYKNRSEIYSVSGFSHFNPGDLPLDNGGVFLYPRPNSWGWATWSDRWKGFKLNQYGAGDLKNYAQLKSFQQGGVDLPWMLRNQIKGKINSWAIQWSYYQFLNQAVTLYPKCSKVQNIGFGDDATHTAKLGGPVGVLCEDVLSMHLDDSLVCKERYYNYFNLGLLTNLKSRFWLGVYRTSALLNRVDD